MDETPEVVNLPERPSPAQPASPSLVHKIFFNDVELRAGWRFLLFLVLLMAVAFAVSFVISHVRKSPPTRSELAELRPGAEIVGDSLEFALVLGVAAIMSKFEKRKLRYYGLPLKSPFLRNFWLGCLWDLSRSQAYPGPRADHNFYFASRTERLETRMAIVWAIAFVAVGLFEESCCVAHAFFCLPACAFGPPRFSCPSRLPPCTWAIPGKLRLACFRLCSSAFSSATPCGAPAPCGLR